MTAYLTAPTSQLASLRPRTASVLDLGSGNGALLFDCRVAGFAGPLVGVDYAPEAVELARRLGRDRSGGGGGGSGGDDGASVRFEVWDVMGADPAGPWLPPAGFDLVLDKGTFDAVCLSGGGVGSAYAARVAGLVRVGGWLLVASCNWTEEELVAWFTAGAGWAVHGRIGYRAFSFGGGTGQAVSSVCFRRVEREAGGAGGAGGGDADPPPGAG
jgi:SAM-dependent methyltransferase